MAGMVRREPRKYIKLSTAAAMYGCSSKTLKRYAQEGTITLIQMNPGRRTTPYLVAEAEILSLIERREKQISF